ncbi:hypothetical protein JTE90_016845 [Oedothorax gibbosus]|uniref:FYVE and coiled-coil domain-containing protein 1 n=1 Tax=Oedothorax gibbosus TaxID=931172 RepID=A0AAV6W0S4_9ARAC|nr:hypothetical protein JTE90_016845 [Oedothorax gibbosus]
MAHSSRTTKAVSTIQECVADLKKSFFTEHTLINDDDAALHRLEEKLELVLSIGLKEKPGVFGGKKSYWDYICACLSSSKRSHPALKFVKTISEIKTSVGRGRAFIRFCLMHNCLADTLQSCFVDIKTTREFYSELSIPLLPKLWSSLVACLYDLNEIHFDLNLQNAELDVSWPSFARKLFVSSETDVVSGRNLISHVPHLLMEDNMSISSESLSSEKEEVSIGTKGIFSQNIPDYEKIKDSCYQTNSPTETDSRTESIRKDSNVKEKSQCAISLQLCLDNCSNLNDSLISRVQDQEIHMKGITKELEEAHKLLSVMREQHQKLQSAENIVKYDLQEKRKLLTRLKEQLESTHEDCKLVRIKNSKSKSEWESLRKEFTLRTKQTSEESGFIDESALEDQCAVIDTSFHENEIISNKDICKNVDDNENKYILKSNRLQMLEEQCKLLCSNLINSSKKREEIDCKLESWCKAIEKNREVAQPEKMSDNISEAQNELKREIVEVVSVKGVDSDSSLLSSGIGSVNSECAFTPNDCSKLSNDICCTSTPLENNSLNLLSISDFVSHQSESFLESAPLEIYPDNSRSLCTELIEENKFMEVASHSGSMNSLKNVASYLSNGQYASAVNSNNYEDSLFNETLSSATKKSKAQETEIRKLREEIAALETKVQELEKTSIILSSQLALKTQQLKLTETAKEQEITALQFQLNSEVLKYERALKEFTMNNSGLNEMKQKVNDQEELVLALEEALAEIQAEREHEKDHQWEDLQDIQLALIAREDECRLLSEDLKKMDDFKKYCLNDKEAMESEIINLRDNEKQLQKKIIKLLKEKDILWQRNDHLAFLQKIRIDDRWMNDSEVSKCLGCSSNFSFLLRKHHCRQCGRIFCHSCSNTWLPSASSKKLIRICNECYKQHLDIKKVVRRDSNVQCCEDSEDESTADTESFSLHRRYILENRPSLAESIVSLPVMHKTSLPPKCNFTSVPQLYIADENQQTSETNPINHNLTSQLKTTFCEKNEEDFLINAGEEAEIPVLCKKKGTSLHWKFTPNDEAIPITLIYEDSNSTSQQTIVHHSSCETAGVIHLKIHGLYKFRFDNSSRSTSISLNYKLKHPTPEEIAEDI